MLLTHVQAYSSGDSIHVQATGPAFPTGYTSCNIGSDCAVSAVRNAEANTTRRFPSMRFDSGAQYVLLTINGDTVYCGDAIVCSLGELVRSLGAPSPAYTETDTPKVSTRVTGNVAAAKQPYTEPTPKSDKTEEISKIREEVRSLLNRLDDLLDD